MEDYDIDRLEIDILELLRRSDKPLSTSEISHTTKTPYHWVYLAIKSLFQKNLLSFSLYQSLNLVPGGVRSGNELLDSPSSFGNELSYRVKPLKVGGKDYKYYWLVDNSDKPVCYIGGGNIKTPLANRYRDAVEAAIRRGEFKCLSSGELKSVISQIKYDVRQEFPSP